MKCFDIDGKERESKLKPDPKIMSVLTGFEALLLKGLRLLYMT